MSVKQSMPWEVRTSRRPSFPATVLALAATIWLLGVCLSAAGAPEKASGKKETPPPKPEEPLLLTNDGLKLATTYYPGTK